MPKYIDLLRNHQPGKPGNPSPDVQHGDEELLDIPSMPAEKSSAQKKKAPKTADRAKTQGREIITDPDIWLDHCIRIMMSFLKAASNRKVVPIEKLWRHLKPQVAAVISDPKQLSALELKVSEDTHNIREISPEFGGMLEKSMNMLLLSIKVGLQLRMSEQSILSLLLAGMLHHAGLARVPIAIRQKSSALTRDERLSIRNATHEGVEYLRACGIGDADTLLAIEQSQERIDGSGPLGLSGAEISRMGRIVGLLSFFEALIHYRPYRQRMLPRDAIRDIILHHKQSFDTNLLKALIDAASLYPIGTYVQLNSGDIGQVIHIHPRLPLRPIVMLSMDRAGHPIDPREVDLKQQTTLLIERCMYAEDIEKSL
ncbi:MAG: hypothetical protein Q9M23_00430 [Mariprofundaceae bacterium]|nr:hypothetical protein [Mariprofundaceae bacterium]